MPITKASIKDVRRIKKRSLRNRTVKSAMHTAIAKARNAPQEKKDLLLRLAVKTIDRAASKGVINKHAASRRVSRLMRGSQEAPAKPAPKAPADKAD